MDKKILAFLNKERVGVISVLLKGGAIHSATVHCSHKENPLKIYIQTFDKSLKAQPFLDGQTGEGALVLGFSEEDWVTLQMHGSVRAVSDPAELEEIYKVHYQKHPDAEKYKSQSTVFLEFTPTWWRYTDFNTDPETLLTS